jgi:hypothetical protein
MERNEELLPVPEYDEYPEEDCGFLDPYCSECKNPCEPTIVDFGIGSYEFWGQRGNDTNRQWVSNCCEAEMHEGPPREEESEEDEED